MSFYTIENDGLIVKDWERLLIADGFDPGLFNKKHQDCPLCGSVKGFRGGALSKKGNDPFRYVCKGCTASEYKTAFDFLSEFHGFHSSTDVYRHIYENILNDEVKVARVAAMPQAQRDDLTPEKVAKSLSTNAYLWSKSQEVRSGDAVWKYLNKRIPGIESIPSDVHYTKAQYWEQVEPGQPSKMLGEYDAMILRGFSPCGQLVQLRTTYLTPDGEKAAVTNVKKTRPGNGFASFAFRIGEPLNGELGLSEGIETALSASLMHDIPVWPCHSCTILEHFEVPKIYKGKIHTIHIFADNDRSKVNNGVHNTGYLAAQSLAKKLRRQGYKVLIHMTARVGDFNDQYKALKMNRSTLPDDPKFNDRQNFQAAADELHLVHHAVKKFANFG